jgi:dipeptidase E
MAGEAYLEYPKQAISDFLGKKPLMAVFIPYAAVTFSYNEYVEKVNERFNEFGQNVVGIHTFADQAGAVENAEAIVIGGGNTWQLLRLMRDNKLLPVIRKKVLSGIPYIGWSAGSNVACPTIKTTNDMPIVDPLGFDALNLVPFQINPHFLDANPDGHAGETREQRIEEFLVANPETYVLGLREGSMLKFEDGELALNGNKTVRVFKNSKSPVELGIGTDFSFLL